MSMTLADAKIYVSRIIGGANTQGVLDMAGEAIQRAYTDWQAARFWTFLLKDTRLPTLVHCDGSNVNADGTALGGQSTDPVPATAVGKLVPAVAGTFDFVNVGQSVTMTPHIQSGTVVLSITRGTDGSVSYILISKPIVTTVQSVTLPRVGSTFNNHEVSFSADIPLKAGIGEYNVPNDMNATYTARLIGANDTKTWLKYIEQRSWDKLSYDQDVNGKPEAYTIYNPISQATQGYGRKRMQIFRTPNGDGTVRLRYFRSFITDGATIDVPDDYLYKFLDYARSLLLETKRAEDDPNGYRASIIASYAEAQQNDEQPNDDDDGDARLRPGYESGMMRGPIVSNGEFDPYPF